MEEEKEIVHVADYCPLDGEYVEFYIRRIHVYSRGQDIGCLLQSASCPKTDNRTCSPITCPLVTQYGIW